MIFAPGQTNVTTIVQICSDVGVPVTGLVAATWPPTYYLIAGQSVPSAITLSDLATQNSAWSSGGVKELTGGYYRLDLPNAAFAAEGHVRISGEASNKHAVHPAIQVSAALSRKQAEVRVCAKTTAGTMLQFDAWLAENGAPINLDTVDPAATCEATIYLFDSDIPQFSLATTDFGAPDGTLGRFRAEYVNPNLTADRIYLIELIIVSGGVSYLARKSFTPIP